MHIGPEHRDHLLERLHHLRTIVPVFAEELANARRESARLRVENRRLLNEVQRLQRERRAGGEDREGAGPELLSISGR